MSVTPGEDGSSLTASYTVAAPGGKWSEDDDGTYTVSVVGGQVLDAAGTAVAGVSTTFAVDVPASLPPVDDTFNGGSNPPRRARAAPAPSPTPAPTPTPTGTAPTPAPTRAAPTPAPTVSSGFVTEASVTQPDGKIVLAGRLGDLTGGTSQAFVERLNADGSLDTSFGNGGKVDQPLRR